MKTAYSLAKLKTFNGRQGQGFSADLLHNGRRVGTVVDEANGGCYHCRWESAADREALEAHAAAMAPRPLGKGYPDFQPDCDTVLDDLVATESLRKLLARKVVMARP